MSEAYKVVSKIEFFNRKMVQNGQNRQFCKIPARSLQKGPICTEQIARTRGLKAKLVKMRSFSRSHRRSKVVKMTKI